MDLNTNLGEHYGYKSQFDFVINNGTGEHVFNQYMIFKNVHDLCKVGGYMIHCLPFYRWVDHGFFNFNPNLFACLSHQNDYHLSHLWIATNDYQRIVQLNTDQIERYTGYREDLGLEEWERDPSVVAIMKRTTDADFRIPIQRMYSGDNIASDEIRVRYRL